MQHLAVGRKFEPQEGCKGSAGAQASSLSQLTYIKIQVTNETSRSWLSPPCLLRQTLRLQALVLARVPQAVAGHPRTPHKEESKATTQGSQEARV